MIELTRRSVSQRSHLYFCFRLEILQILNLTLSTFMSVLLAAAELKIATPHDAQSGVNPRYVCT